MDILHFNSVSFQPGTNIGQLCEELKMFSVKAYITTLKIQNAKWLWLVNNLVTVMNKNNILCGAFGLFPIYVAVILNSVKDITFYVLCSEKLNYLGYIKKCIADKKCTISHTGNYFQLSYGGETIYISFEARIYVENSRPNYSSHMLC